MKQVLILMLLLLANAIEAQTKRVVDVKDGQALEALLGEDMLEIDTLVVKGSLKHTDFPVMRQCLAKGKLRVIDLGESEVENDSLPENAFYISFDPVHLDSIVLPKNASGHRKRSVLQPNNERNKIPDNTQKHRGYGI